MRIHRTSGTTGRSLTIGFSQRDVEVVTRLGGRAMFCAGRAPGTPRRALPQLPAVDRRRHRPPDHRRQAGATVVPFGVGQTRKLLETIAELGVTAHLLHAVVSGASREGAARGDGPRAPRDSACGSGSSAARPGSTTPRSGSASRRPGASRSATPTSACRRSCRSSAASASTPNDLHFHARDAVFAELLDPASGERAADPRGDDGRAGLHASREGVPAARALPDARRAHRHRHRRPAPCGRTTWRFRVTGRTDDMFNVRGVNVFPTAVQQGGRRRPPDLASGQFRIVLAGPEPYDRIDRARGSRAGPAAGALAGGGRRCWSAGSARRSARRPPSPCSPFEALPRTEGKTRLVERDDRVSFVTPRAPRAVGIVTLNRPERLNAMSRR